MMLKLRTLKLPRPFSSLISITLPKYTKNGIAVKPVLRDLPYCHKMAVSNEGWSHFGGVVVNKLKRAVWENVVLKTYEVYYYSGL